MAKQYDEKFVKNIFYKWSIFCYDVTTALEAMEKHQDWYGCDDWTEKCYCPVAPLRKIIDEKIPQDEAWDDLDVY